MIFEECQSIAIESHQGLRYCCWKKRVVLKYKKGFKIKRVHKNI